MPDACLPGLALPLLDMLAPETGSDVSTAPERCDLGV